MFNHLNFNEMPYIVAKYLASKLVNLLIWWRFFWKKLWFLAFGLFGGGGEAVGYWLLAVASVIARNGAIQGLGATTSLTSPWPSR